MIGSKPYTEKDSIRTFETNVDDYELEWHIDFEDRIVKIIQASNWKLQFDNKVPNTLFNNQEIFIEKMAWHRIIKGDGPLIVQITKLS
jgi:hypothetical protein